MARDTGKCLREYTPIVLLTCNTATESTLVDLDDLEYRCGVGT